jgi:hypothetical protein
MTALLPLKLEPSSITNRLARQSKNARRETRMTPLTPRPVTKKQQMQWSKRGAHLLLQARVKTLNREWAAVFKQWYPDIQVEEWDEVA